jgi:hypothetical protein
MSMKPRHPLLAALAASAGLALRAGAQIPVTPSPLPPPGEPIGIAPHPAVPTGSTIWSKLGISQDQCEYCKRKICRTPLGQLLNNSTLPLQGLSGGLIPPFCPVGPSVAELADPGAVGAAAKIKLDEAGAKERRAAVRYLGTVDCHYWPEAEEALIGALRGDRNECVRFEAALALGNGCCCTKKTIEALTIVVSCSNRDGAPKENSFRVLSAAQAALDHCIACYGPIAAAAPPPPPPEGRPVVPPEGAPESLPGPVPVPAPPAGAAVKAPAMPRPTGFQYYARIAQMPLEPILAEARRVAALHPHAAKPEAEALPPGERSLIGLVNYVVGKDAPAAKSAPAPVRTSTPARGDATARADAARPAANASRPTSLMAMLAKPTPMGPAIPAPTVPAPMAQSTSKAPSAKAPAVTSAPAENPPKLLPTEMESQPRRIAADVASTSPAPTTAATKQSEPPVARAPAPPAPVVWSAEPPLATKKPAPPAAADRAADHLAPPVVWSAEPPVIKQPVPAAPAPAATNQAPTSTARAPMPSAPPPMVWSAEQPPVTKQPAPAVPAPAAAARTTQPPTPPMVWSAEPPLTKQSAPTAPAPLPVATQSPDAAPARAPEPPAPVVPSIEPPVSKHPAPVAPAPIAVPHSPEPPAPAVMRSTASAPVAKQPAPVAPAPAATNQVPAAGTGAAPTQAAGPALPPVIIQTALATPPKAPPAAAPLAAAAQQPVTTSNGPRADNSTVTARSQTSPTDKPSAGGSTATASASTSSTPAKSAQRGQSPDRLQPADLQAAPELVDDLIRGATGGANLAERRACIRALVRCRIKTPAAMKALEDLQHDLTPQVRVDAIIGLARLQTNQ